MAAMNPAVRRIHALERDRFCPGQARLEERVRGAVHDGHDERLPWRERVLAQPEDAAGVRTARQARRAFGHRPIIARAPSRLVAVRSPAQAG
jgi:hypothetical protein